MDYIKLEEPEKACRNEKDHKVRIRMVTVRMVRVINTADTAPARRAAYGCESPWTPLDNKAFLGSAVPERPSRAVPEAAATGLERLPCDKPDVL